MSMPVPLVDFQGGHGRFSVFLGECRGATDDNSPAFQCRVGREMVASPAGTTEFSRSCGTYGHVQTPPALKRRPIVGLSRWDGRLRRTKPRPACQNIRFPAGANVSRRLAMTHRHGRKISTLHDVGADVRRLISNSEFGILNAELKLESRYLVSYDYFRSSGRQFALTSI